MKEILEILERDCRLSYEEIAKLTNKTPEEVKRLIKEYEKKGVIVKYKAMINHAALKEEKLVALIEVKIVPQKDVGFDLVAERIYQFPEVRSCYLVSGDYDLLLVVEGKDIHTIASFVSEKLAPLNQVRGTVTHFLLKKYKEDNVILVKKTKNKRLAITY